MNTSIKNFFSEEEKNMLIEKLTPELPLLRTKAEVSQEDISNIIGITRQTYGSIERKSRKMSWNTYLALIWFFDCNKKTHKMIRNMEAFPYELIKKINDGAEIGDLELDLILQFGKKNIFSTLDEQALSTIKTILMVEYSRCNNVYGEGVVKFFEGIDLLKTDTYKKQKSTAQAIKNIKRKK